jgi:hypothetical protein
MKSSKSESHKNKYSKWIVFLSIIFLLIIIRLILPYVVLHYANKTLDNLKGYKGHIDDIDLSLYKGAYVINEFYIDKIDSALDERVPFISSKVINLSVEWKSLFQGRIVGKLEFSDPVICFTKDKAEPAKIQNDTNEFRKVLKRFMPLKVNRLEMKNGKIQYIDSTSKPAVNIIMDNFYVLAQNLSNVKDTSLLPANIVANANIYGGKLDFKMKMNPISDPPAFEMNVKLENTNLPDFNDFFRAYANLSVNQGTLSLYAEVAGKDNKFIGYVKPIIKDLKVLGPQNRNDSFLSKIWGGIAGLAGVVFKNQKESQLATKIPISGKYGVTSVKVWYTILNILRNAFIQALYPSIDHQINLSTVDRLGKKDNSNILKKISDESSDPKEKNNPSSKHKKSK